MAEAKPYAVFFRRMLVVLFLLGVEEVMVQLRVNGITQASLVKVIYIGVELYAHFV